MATIILNTDASVRDHSLRMKFGDVYVVPSNLLTGDNVCQLMSFFSNQKVLVFMNQVSNFFRTHFIFFFLFACPVKSLIFSYFISSFAG